MIWGNKDPMQPKWWEESKPSFPSSSSEAGTAAIPLNPAFSVAEVTLIQPCPEILKIKIHFCLYRICWVWYLHLAHAMVFITTEMKTDSRKGLTVPGTDFLMTFFFFFFLAPILHVKNHFRCFFGVLPWPLHFHPSPHPLSTKIPTAAGLLLGLSPISATAEATSYQE